MTQPDQLLSSPSGSSGPTGWRPQLPDKYWEAIAYNHICPQCRGYLRDRGGPFTCDECGYEYDPKISSNQPALFEQDPEWQEIPDATGFASDQAKYGAFLGAHLDAIEAVGKHIDEIRKFALEDIENGGKGFIFRNRLLNLNLPGVGPKVASFAWLLLAPMTSELGVIDSHIMRGMRRPDESPSVRDYYKYERMQRAAKDATGYSHVPLGLYHWGLWDAIRNPGVHSDHSALRALDPLPWDSPDAKWDAATSAKSGPYAGPIEFEAARGAMEAAGLDFDATFKDQPRNQVPDIQAITAQPRTP